MYSVMWNKIMWILILFLKQHFFLSLIKFTRRYILYDQRSRITVSWRYLNWRVILIRTGQHQEKFESLNKIKVHFKHLLLRFTYNEAGKCGLVQVLILHVFSVWLEWQPRLPAYSDSFVRTLEEFQYSKVSSFLLSCCETLSHTILLKL